MRDLFSVESGFSRTISGFSRTLSGFSRTVCGFSRTCGSCIAVMLLALLMAPGASLRSEQAPAPSADLAAIFSPGDVLQDRNGDGFVDFINARIVLGDRPGAADVSAAADVAARFGFETLAMDLPVLSPADDVRGATPFIIGADAARRMGVALPAAAMPGPGDGMI